MDYGVEKIEKRRRIQVGIYVLHLGLLIGGLIYFVLLRELIFAIGAGVFIYYAAMDLLSKTSTIRAPIDKLGIRSIGWNLRLLDLLLIGLLVSLRSRRVSR